MVCPVRERERRERRENFGDLFGFWSQERERLDLKTSSISQILI